MIEPKIQCEFEKLYGIFWVASLFLGESGYIDSGRERRSKLLEFMQGYDPFASYIVPKYGCWDRLCVLCKQCYELTTLYLHQHSVRKRMHKLNTN